MEILHQLGELFLAAVPTAVIVLIFYFFLRWSFFGPITGVMAERHARIEGARHYAESVRAAAREKTKTYQETLRKTRAEIFGEQEAARRKALDERSASIQKARSHANEEIHAAKMRIAAKSKRRAANWRLRATSLAEQIVRAIFERQPSPAGEAR